MSDGATGGQTVDGRTLDIHALRAAGWTLQAIGDRFGLTRERVRQILAESNGPTAQQVRDHRAALHAREVARWQRELIDWLRANPGRTADAARAAKGWNEQQLSEAMSDEARRLAVRTHHGAIRKWTEEEVLDAMRSAWNLTKTNSTGLSYKQYNKLLESGLVDGPTAVRILQIFGTWQQAADRAGIPAGKKPNRSYESAWTDEEILAVVRRYLADPSTRGAFHTWDEWKRIHAPDAPSGGTMRNRLGQWSEIKKRALAEN